MATYGQGQMLGSGINPESFKQDYSGFANAAAMQAQGIANLGQSIGGAIQDYGKFKKQQQQDERDVQKSKSVAKAIGDLIPDLKPTLQNSLMLLDNKELPLSQRKAEADAISDILTLGIGAITNKQKLDLERSQIEAATNEANARAAAEAGAEPPTKEFALPTGGRQAFQWNSQIKKYVPVQVDMEGGGVLPPAQGVSLVDLVKGFEGFNPKAYGDFKQTSIGYGTRGKPGEIITEEEANNRLQTELAGHAKNIQNAAAAQGITLNENQFNALTSFDFNTGRGADLINRFGKDPQQLASKMLEYTKAGGQDLPGLVKRRQIEAALFLGGQPTVTPAQGRVGFTPDKIEKTETFRPATAEESAMYGGMPGQMSSTGKFIPINLPSGFSIEQTPGGGLTVVQGAGVGGKQAAQKAASEAYKMKNATALSQELNRLEDTTQDMVPGVAGSVARMAGERIPGTDLAARKATIDRVVSTLTLQSLQDMRNSSPTGASLGNISNMDVGLLRDSASALSNAQNPEEFQRELTRLQNLQYEIIYGKESVLRDKLSKKEITQTQFDEAMAAAPKRFIDERGQIQFRNTAAPTNNAPDTGLDALEAKHPSP